MAISSNFRIEDRITMSDKYITMVQGDTLCFAVEIEDQDGLPVDLSSANTAFICKKTYDNVSTLFKKQIGSGITKVSDGVYAVKVAPADTSSADPGLYYYDFRVGYGSDIFTIMKGILEIQPKVTG